MAAIPNNPPPPTPNTSLNFIYVVPVTYTPEDNETYINKIEVKVLQCLPIPANDLSSLWNCERCANDDNYCTPVVDGDLIYLQLPINDPDVNLYAIYAYDAEGNILNSGAATNIYQVKDSDNGNNYLNINVDVSLLDSECFYFKVIGVKCPDIDEAAISVCTEQRQIIYGENFSQASYTCLTEACPDFNSYFTDMYCKNKCKDTLLLEGDYPGYDCDGNFYGIPFEGDASQQHKLQIRVPATIELVEYGFTETLLNNQKIKSQQLESWLFRTQKVPAYVVTQLAKIFNSKSVVIDSETYNKAVKLSKNFEEGKMWIISETLTKSCDEINFTCNT